MPTASRTAVLFKRGSIPQHKIDWFRFRLDDLCETAWKDYLSAIGMGIDREKAKLLLPAAITVKD